MDDSPVPVKRPKGTLVSCIICGQETRMSSLVQPKDVKSWDTLGEAANIRLFNPILKLKKDNPNILPELFYHRYSRSNFTHKKELSRLKKLLEEAETEASHPTYSLRQGFTETTRVYERKCIFCESSNKCLKGTSTRESLIQAVDLCADVTLRNVANLKDDTKLLAITS